jgi:hypothetical protein
MQRMTHLLIRVVRFIPEAENIVPDASCVFDWVRVAAAVLGLTVTCELEVWWTGGNPVHLSLRNSLLFNQLQA